MKEINDDIQMKYFWWLAIRVNEDHKDYVLLLKELYSRSFYYILDDDRERLRDGIALREKWCSEVALDNESYKKVICKPCSILEMMIALARRIEVDMLGSGSYAWIFWKMIENLGLEGMSDLNYDSSEISLAIDALMLNEYEDSGKGGLFYISDDVELKGMSIWNQAMKWVNTQI